MKIVVCNVRHCRYKAVTSIEDVFPVCSLHDHDATRGILARGLAPAAYWMANRPLVIPCGPLVERDLEEREGGTMDAFEDPFMSQADDRPTHAVKPEFDLTR